MLQEAWKLVARRAHSRSEMRIKLHRKGFQGDDVEAALERLSVDGLLDDADFALGRIRASRPTRSRLQLAADLQRRGVGGPDARQALAELPTEHDLDAARALIRRWPGLRTELIGQRLARRGFDSVVVRRVLIDFQEANDRGPSRA